MKEFYNHIKKIKPVLDCEKKFTFFYNLKVAQTSINRDLLKNRAIVPKDDFKKYKKILSLYDIDNTFKFTIVRNPWDRVVSGFMYLMKLKEINYTVSGFKDFIKSLNKDKDSDEILFPGDNVVLKHLNTQFNRAYFNDKCFVDFIGKLENIKKDWDYISNIINCSSNLSHINKTNHHHYRDYYDEECKQIIYNIYEKDIELFKYKF